MKSLMLQAVALLALTPFCLGCLSGCDANSHGGSPTTAGASNGSGEGSDPGADTVNGSSSGGSSSGGSSTDSAEDGDDATSVAEPMPLPVRNNDEVVEITFDDLNLQMQADMVFRDFLLTDRVQELNGRRVRIAGVMYPTERIRGVKEFILLKNTECKYGPGGQADHLISVTLKDDESTEYLGDRPISVEGVFRVNPDQGLDGFTWSVYDLKMGENVTEVRR